MLSLQERSFIGGLESRLHSLVPFTFVPNISGKPFTAYDHEFSDSSLTTGEVERLLGIIEKAELVLYPRMTGPAAGYGYQVAEPLRKKKPILLTFESSQLPGEYSFSRMAEIFMSKSNRGRARKYEMRHDCELTLVNDEEYYAH